MSPFYCKIYTTGDIALNDLRSEIASLIGSNRLSVSFIENDFYDVSVRENEEFDSRQQVSFPDGFLFFEYLIELDFIGDVHVDKCVEVIAEILRWLWNNGMPAVASCDYETLLPENGGYRSKKVPWVS